MANYTKTILKGYPDYINRIFLLANSDREKLYIGNGSYIEITIDRMGKLSVFL